MNFVSVEIQQSFQNPSELVFDAFLDPKQIGHWMFGPKLRDEEILRIQVDPRIGGEFSFLVRRPATPEGTKIDHVGKYLEITKPKTLSFTWAIGTHDENSSRVTIRLIPTPAGCEATLTHEMPAEWADFADRTRGAWKLMLGSLARLLDQEAS